MATIVLSAAGAAVGGGLGGSFLGLSTAVAGRALGATLGHSLDQRLMGRGSDVIETGKVDRFRVTGASEGSAVAKVYGATRVPGQVIWASNFLERRSTSSSSGGKGGPKTPSVRSYSYSLSMAVALCEGEISHIGRIWADGSEISRDSMTLRVYLGSRDQLPDPKISAVEGARNAPAYRGTAYVVIEDLDLSQFGNRVPQLSFEVVRPDQNANLADAPTMREGVRAVALIPGTGEYSLATTAVHYSKGPATNSSANVHGSESKTDFLLSMDAMDAEIPNCGSVSLVVSWFGDDLRCDRAQIQPRVEQKTAEGVTQAWRVSGVDRLQASEVPRVDEKPVYGGTPSDDSVVEAIREIRRRGKDVVFYPFILMEQLSGNALTDPWTGSVGQPALPWRGRITTSKAPGAPGAPDGMAAATAEVASFFGIAKASDFTVDNGRVTYKGPAEWGLRRFILHYAALCKAAGGVEAFCIGSEMRALSQVRGAANSFPAVDQLRELAAEVRSLLGPSTKVGYAADWSEYFGYSPQDGSGDHFFHLDPLWSDTNIDFIGIDNYMPLSDWRDGDGHADSEWDSIYDLEYLKSNIAGGEGFDWYYADNDAADRQDRTPITDGAYGEPWVFRYKDLVSWWSKQHHDRVGGTRRNSPTNWTPKSKPIWFTELGCAAIDKGTNQPNKFLDPKSSESKLPRASTGARDDLIQMQYLRAMFSYWNDSQHNPTSPLYGGRMVDMGRAHVWAWDARPYPWFPGLPDVWSDGDNYARGHWLNGRMGSRLLSSVVSEIVEEAGIANADVSKLYGLVRGYAVSQPAEARRALEPLMLAYGFEVVERDGVLSFRSRTGKSDAELTMDSIAVHPEQDADVSFQRAADAEISSSVQLVHVNADGSFETASSEAIFPDAENRAVAQSELNLVLTAAEARAIAERWLAEARTSRDSLQLALPLSKMEVGAGDVFRLSGTGGDGHYRIDKVEVGEHLLLDAVRVDPGLYGPGSPVEEQPRLQGKRALMPPTPILMDLPLVEGTEQPHAPYIAVAAEPWPGEIAVWSSPTDSDYQLNTLLDTPSIIGVTRSPLRRASPGIFDRGDALRVEISGGALSSVQEDALFNGANAMAIGDGTPENWEIFQFQRANLIAPEVYDLEDRLRGQLGTDALIPDVWPEGSWVVLLDSSVEQLNLTPNALGLNRHYRIGAASQAYDHVSFEHVEAAFQGAGMRPFAPAHLRAAATEMGDVDVSWIRRTRIDGDRWGVGEVPIGEDREVYVVRVWHESSLKRETYVDSSMYRYSSADRVADGVTGSFEIDVAQVSDRFGPGPSKRIEING